VLAIAHVPPSQNFDIEDPAQDGVHLAVADAARGEESLNWVHWRKHAKRLGIL